MTEVNNEMLLKRAKELSDAANAAVGSESFNPAMLSVYSEIVNDHGNFVVRWTATMGQFSSNGGAATPERALRDLADNIARHASVLAQG
jgi:hypothetical protein